MENLFRGLIADKSNKLVGSGENPTAIGKLGDSMARIKSRMVLPTEISPQKVLELEKEIGKVTAEMELADQIISAQEKLLNDAVALHDKNTKWASVTMRVDQKLREIESSHNQQIARYALGAAKTQVFVDGYTSALKVSEEIFG